ncbi:hypothetical protein FPSE_06768 [Fusarium pseudograminearum CS3096]|uniref:Uncharacterized protein n=1 Tax=Fusarium pseudograminearum (strain CS3096) TaxID=1028729 RepID=K3VZX4_FUSPC|nr:hypothetical protein FPSE_06768 [Fusarium pseudograminearum CS3096]EKJ73155.1 hypothetical protein FPSE_06768 [Fusarium pseudograminearum CS3096]
MADPQPDQTGSRKKKRNYFQECAILIGDCGPIFASGKSLCDTKLGAQLGAFRPADEDPWVGIQIKIPLGKDQAANEASGFGVLHAHNSSQDAILANDQYVIQVRFPRESLKQTFGPVSDKLAALFPDTEALSYIIISLGDSKPTIFGYGRPYANTEDIEMQGWVNENKPIIGQTTLLDVLQFTEYHIVIPIKVAVAEKNIIPDRLPPPFEFPYAIPEAWRPDAFKRDIAANPGHKYKPNYMLPDNDSLITTIAQSIVQDMMWLDDAVQVIKVPGYFIPADTETISRYYVVVALPPEFIKGFDAAWRRLTKNADAFNLLIWGSRNMSTPKADWDCRLMSHPANLEQLADHPISDHEIVLLVRRPQPGEKRNNESRGDKYDVKTFANREWLSLEFDAGNMEAERQVNAALDFRHDAQPSNPGAYDLPMDHETDTVSDNLTRAQRKTYEMVIDRMELHREVMRGSGFYHWMTSEPPTSQPPKTQAPSSEPKHTATSLRNLPTINFLDINDDAYANCIVEEALPEDRARFRGYLSNRPLGLGIITAGAGFGKTTAGAAATLAMEAKVGKVLCSGPTNVAIDNFSRRLFSRSQAIADHYNKGKALGDPTRRQYKLVLRAYNPTHEHTAFTHLLEDPKAVQNAAPTSAWKFPSKWKLPLSCAFWILLALGSRAAGRELHPDDPVFVHELRNRIAQRKDLTPLSEFAQGKITCEEFTEAYSQKQCMEAVEGLMSALVRNADFLCVTPAASQYHKSYREWKITAARAVAVDEAACMSRADLCCVWGNTLLPCFMFGDPRQLPPTVLTKRDTLTNTDHFVNRFSSYGEVSAMSALMASGLPVYRLKVQLRMVQGMFDLVSSVIYPDVPFTYHMSRAATNPEFKVGQEIETYLGVKFPELSVPIDGALRPVFIHCEGSRVFQDPKTGSKRSRDQVKVGLDVLQGAVESLEIDPKDIAVISPYAANVKLINSMRRNYPALHALPDAATIDSFQGQESIITLVIMGTAHPRPGPGFTQNKQRLNVLLTRQKCALIIIGDINVGNPFRKGTKEPVFTVETTTGEMSFVKAPALRAIYRGLKDTGRVVTVDVKAETDNVSDPDTKT